MKRQRLSSEDWLFYMMLLLPLVLMLVLLLKTAVREVVISSQAEKLTTS